MVESSAGGSCRCACQEDFRGEEGEDRPSSTDCCSPQVFTSVLLGVLACVLMTGGVFLAFHRWDPLWLIVSGIGVVLILIGSVLHCCSSGADSAHDRTRGRNPGGGGKGGCCGRPEHHLHGHLVANNGSLTEQLLPLSNARSVSQLSLNMLPGYFPPVVTTYGIEQHSAVVQNINRLVQQQQQSPSCAAGPQSQGGAQSGAGGKSFILLSLPGDTTQANIQNLVATVYQLEGSTATEAPPAEAAADPPPATSSAPSSPTATPIPTTQLVPVLFKSVEVQTCNMWPINVASGSGLANIGSQNTASASTSTEIEVPQPSTSAVTQTEETPIDLMDCSVTDIPPPPRICDSARTQTCSDQTADCALTNIPASSSVLVDISEPAAVQSGLVVATPESAGENLFDLAPEVLIEVEEGTASCSVDVPDVLIDISDSSGTSTEPSEIAASITPSSDSVASVNLDLVEDTNGDASNVASTSNHLQVGVSSSELSLGNLSDFDEEVDDSELIGRSSPPPSYDDATHEGENAIGAFGLAYGTI